MDDRFNLARFVAAQAETYAAALAELRHGQKTSHWMWFIFPQMPRPDTSATSRFYAIGSADEARAYLAHPLLGPRLLACTAAVCGHAGTPPEEIFDTVDALKLQSSLTLFAAVSEAGSPFAICLKLHFGGRPDAATLRTLGL